MAIRILVATLFGMTFGTAAGWVNIENEALPFGLLLAIAATSSVVATVLSELTVEAWWHTSGGRRSMMLVWTIAVSCIATFVSTWGFYLAKGAR